VLAIDSLETRRCYDCGLVKPISEFAFANRSKGTRQGRCRRCHAAYRRAHYLRNRDTYIRQEVARIRRYREENRPLLYEYLRAHPCVDCGETDIVVLEFDHRDPSAKKHSVTLLAMHKSWSRVLLEIAKCDVRCVVCHRRRTALQFNWRSRLPRTTTADVREDPPRDDLGLFAFASGIDPRVKTCTKCGVVTVLPAFPFKDRALGKRGSRCRLCMAAYSREHYRLNRARYLKRARKRRRRDHRRNESRIFRYLLEHSCVDCGETDPLLLDFDHRDSISKRDVVARLARRRPWREVLAEIEKCDVRCVRCHRRKTARQFRWMRDQLRAS
jgi:hypothetical protein